MKTAELTFFIVEDDAEFRETFIDAMSLRGVVVRGVGTGAEGLRGLQELVSRDAAPSAIVLDVKLPDIHGFELCRRIKRVAALKSTPVIFISASAQYNDARDRVEGFLAGASAFLSKPISLEQVWAEIEPLLGR